MYSFTRNNRTLDFKEEENYLSRFIIKLNCLIKSKTMKYAVEPK